MWICIDYSANSRLRLEKHGNLFLIGTSLSIIGHWASLSLGGAGPALGSGGLSIIRPLHPGGELHCSYLTATRSNWNLEQMLNFEIDSASNLGSGTERKKGPEHALPKAWQQALIWLAQTKTLKVSISRCTSTCTVL